MSDTQLFKPDDRNELQRVLSKMNREQLLWLGGYISAAIDFAPAVQETYNSPIIEPAALAQTAEIHNNQSSGPSSLSILYGSHSGNSKKIAQLAQKEAERLGLSATVKNMENYKARSIKDEEQILIIVSTHGEGDPPLSAQELYDKLESGKGLTLENIPFAVIALGDSSYDEFCKTGYDFHGFLKKLGGRPLRDVVALDTDFSKKLPELLPSIVKLFSGQAEAKQIHTPIKSDPKQFESDQPIDVEIIEKIQLNGCGSGKETWHIEIAADHKSLAYQPGDAIEVYANNSPELVASILQKAGLAASEMVELDTESLSIEEALLHHLELTLVTAPVVKKYAALLENNTLNRLLDDPEQLNAFLRGLDVLDLLSKYPVKLTAQLLASTLRPLAPRAYSIASSMEEVGDEVHITVGAVRFEKDERARGGVCSTYLADRTGLDDKLKVRIKANDQFRLPANGDVPLIMVGAGTGIAPFRGFVQHRAATASKGKNWLIFGDRNFSTDFLYQAEWLKYKKDGVLTKLDVAFSRDKEEKCYVQHRMKANSKELYQWISEGAHFYVCGDMKKMAPDVKGAFLEILQSEGNMSQQESVDYLARLRKEKRYQEDIY